MGEIYRVWYCEDRDSDNSPDSVILKIAPKHLGRRAKFNLRNLFLREITMYDEVRFNCHHSKLFLSPHSCVRGSSKQTFSI